MYNFIFYVMYNYQKSKSSSDAYSRFNGTLITTFEIMLQIILCLVVMEKIFKIQNSGLTQYPTLVLIFMFLIGILIFKFYNNVRIIKEAVQEKYYPTIFRKLIVFTMIVVPLFLIGFLSKK